MLLAHLVLVLAEVHNPAYRRDRPRSHFNKVVTMFPRQLQSFGNSYNPELSSLFIDESDFP